MTALDNHALDKLFNEARTFTAFTSQPVSDEVLRQAYDLAKMAPTAMNMSPLRIVFVRSPEAKEKLKPSLAPGNVDKTMKAPVTAILAADGAFYDHLPTLSPHMPDARSRFADNPALASAAAQMNATLQAAYFIIAARSLGLDCGPMGGFDREKVDAAFFEGTPYRSVILCNLGYGDREKLFPRAPRLTFDQVAKII